LFGSDYKWSVLCTVRNQLSIAAQAAAIGGNVRFVLEDSLWSGPGRFAQSNAEQVRAVGRIIEGLGLSVASPDEAREILQLKGDDRVAFGRPSVREMHSCCASSFLSTHVPNSAKVRYGTSPSSASIGSTASGAKVHSCDADGGAARTWDAPEHIGSLALRERGGAVVSLRDGFYVLDFVSGACRKLVDPDPGNARIRMNDGKVDRQGRFVAGYMDYEERDPICALFRLDPTGAVAKLDDGIVCSNGPCWSPDGRTFYFADTYTREIWAYDYDMETGTAANRQVFCSFPAAGLKGLPDGATVDAEGFVWSVSVYEGKLVRFGPDGKLDRVVGLPVESTTSLSFGGPGLDVAYVTSMARAVKGVKPKEREAGALFAVHGLGVRGLPEPRFAG
jgi:sugar lactone lactonase YvrE